MSDESIVNHYTFVTSTLIISTDLLALISSNIYGRLQCYCHHLITSLTSTSVSFKTVIEELSCITSCCKYQQVIKGTDAKFGLNGNCSIKLTWMDNPYIE